MGEQQPQTENDHAGLRHELQHRGEDLHPAAAARGPAVLLEVPDRDAPGVAKEPRQPELGSGVATEIAVRQVLHQSRDAGERQPGGELPGRRQIRVPGRATQRRRDTVPLHDGDAPVAEAPEQRERLERAQARVDKENTWLEHIARDDFSLLVDSHEALRAKGCQIIGD